MVFGHNLPDPPQFLRREVPPTFQADGLKPTFRLAVVTFHMNMRRFLAIASVEEKVRTSDEDFRHPDSHALILTRLAGCATANTAIAALSALSPVLGNEIRGTKSECLFPVSVPRSVLDHKPVD